MIGMLGDLEFVASSNKTQTFQGININQSARYAEHASLQRKPVLEFLGPNIDEIPLKLQWRVEDKINPVAELEKLRKKMFDGEVLTFFLGTKKVGSGKYVITDMSQTYNRIDNKGNVLSVSADITLKEVVEKEKAKEEKVTKKPTKLTKKQKVAVAKNKAILASYQVSPILGANLTAADIVAKTVKKVIKK